MSLSTNENFNEQFEAILKDIRDGKIKKENLNFREVENEE